MLTTHTGISKNLFFNFFNPSLDGPKEFREYFLPLIARTVVANILTKTSTSDTAGGR